VQLKSSHTTTLDDGRRTKDAHPRRLAKSRHSGCGPDRNVIFREATSALRRPGFLPARRPE